MVELSTAIAALTGAANLVKTAIATRDDRKVNHATAALSERLIDVVNASLALQEKNYALVQEKAASADQIRELQRKVADYERFEADMQQYDRYKTAGEGVCLIDRTTRASLQTRIYLCANCAELHRKTYLQPTDGGWYLECHLHGKIPSDQTDSGATFDYRGPDPDGYTGY